MGKFVFAVDTIANRCTDNDYAIAVSVKTREFWTGAKVEEPLRW